MYVVVVVVVVVMVVVQKFICEWMCYSNIIPLHESAV